MNHTYFSHARTALKVGLENLNFPKNTKILLPNFICNVVIHPIIQNNLRYTYYDLHDDLSPNYEDITSKIDSDTRAIIIVHYFGKAQNINRIEEFCHKYKLIFIEDNSHGYKGCFINKELGTFGFFGISSPRKFLNVSCGGILHKNKLTSINHNIVKQYPTNQLRSILVQNFLNKFPNIKFKLKKLISRKPNFLDPLEFHEKEIKDFVSDYKSLEIIENTNWKEHKEKRFKNYCKWEKFCKDKNLKPIFNEIDQDFNPWCFPVYVNDLKEKKYLLD